MCISFYYKIITNVESAHNPFLTHRCLQIYLNVRFHTLSSLPIHYSSIKHGRKCHFPTLFSLSKCSPISSRKCFERIFNIFIHAALLLMEKLMSSYFAHHFSIWIYYLLHTQFPLFPQRFSLSGVQSSLFRSLNIPIFLNSSSIRKIYSRTSCSKRTHLLALSEINLSHHAILFIESIESISMLHLNHN